MFKTTGIDHVAVNTNDMEAMMDQKETALRRLDAVLSSRSSDFDPDTVLADLTAAPMFAWNAGPLTGTATFEDLRSSGRLRLIRGGDWWPKRDRVKIRGDESMGELDALRRVER